MKFYSKIIASFLFLFIPFFPLYASVGQLDFGGKVLMVIPCTCTPIPTYHIIYTAFYSPLKQQIGALDYSPIMSPPVVAGAVGGPATYSFFNVSVPPGINDIGSYTPGVQSCFMWSAGTPPYCEPIGTGQWSWAFISQGLIYKVGSSLVPSPTPVFSI